jgi:hypothetical protein
MDVREVILQAPPVPRRVHHASLFTISEIALDFTKSVIMLR